MSQYYDDSEFDTAYDEAEVEGAAPEGVHIVQVLDVIHKVTQQSGERLIEWKLKIIDGPDCGLVFKKTSFLKPAQARWVKQDFALLGYTCPFSALLPLLPSIRGAIIEVEVRRKNGWLNTYFIARKDSPAPATAAAPALPPPEDIPF